MGKSHVIEATVFYLMFNQLCFSQIVKLFYIFSVDRVYSLYKTTTAESSLMVQLYYTCIVPFKLQYILLNICSFKCLPL